MTVFKGNMIIIKRNLGLGVMYLAIFLFIAILAGNGQKTQEAPSFDVVSTTLGIVDLDQSVASTKVSEFLDATNTVIYYENDKEVLTEALYYEEVSTILVIPEGFEEACKEGNAVVDITKAVNSTVGIYVDMDVNNYINLAESYLAAGFHVEEAMQYAFENSQIVSNVEIIDVGDEREQVPSYNYFFRFAPYVYLSVLIFMLGNILLPKNQRDMKQRLKCAAVSENRQNLETFLAFAIIGVILFLVFGIIAALLFGSDFLNENMMVYYMLNSFVFMIVSLCVAFLIAHIAKGQEALSGLANVVSLGMSFLGGVFVPLYFLGEQVLKVSKFLPTYWYETNVSMLGQFEVLTEDNLSKFVNGLFAQLAIAAVCVTFAFLLNRRKEVRAK